MPAAMPPVRIIDHIWALDSACLGRRQVRGGLLRRPWCRTASTATVIASPRAVSRPTALPTRVWIWFWLRLPATALSMHHRDGEPVERARRGLDGLRRLVHGVVVRRRLLVVVGVAAAGVGAASGMFSGPRTPPTGVPLPLYFSVVVLDDSGGVPLV